MGKKSIENPYVSFVVTSRNDNHGGDLLKRMNIFPYVLGLGIAFKPQYLHCSNFWPPYLSTRTHLLASINLKKRKALRYKIHRA